jgi:4-amino-4-deoxy-L-arabinose transferase-like glycosyltransferase
VKTDRSIRLAAVAIIAVAALIRWYFAVGHVFSDDAYFTYLAHTLFMGDYGVDYIGYPVSPLRINLMALTALAFSVFGTNEFATMVFPFIFSLANLVLTFYFARLLFNRDDIALAALFMMAFFPTDVIFATISFTDSPASFFINLGLYYLLRAYREHSYPFAIVAGLLFAVSLQFKINIFFTGLLLGIIWLYLLIRRRRLDFFIPLALSFVLWDLLLEGFIYYHIHGDFLYRFTMTDLNYFYGRNDHFIAGSRRGYPSEADYLPAVIKQVLWVNPRYLFLRRFYLFTPILAAIESVIMLRDRKRYLSGFWFLGLVLLYIGFTASFQRYQPLNLYLSWYIYPLFLPAVLLSARFLFRFGKVSRYVVLTMYLIGGLYFSHHYTVYFQAEENDRFKDYLRANPSAQIWTDHFTAYSIDLIDGYPEPGRTNRILGRSFRMDSIPAGALVVFNPTHIDELESQVHEYPDFSILRTKKYKPVFHSGSFEVFRKE